MDDEHEEPRSEHGAAPADPEAPATGQPTEPVLPAAIRRDSRFVIGRDEHGNLTGSYARRGA